VLVATDLLLVAQTVASGLSSHGLEPVLLDWPSAVRTGSIEVGHGAHTGLLMSDLSDVPRVLQASALVRAVPVQWIVQTTAPRGEVWGAVLEAGAEIVLPASVGLAEIAALLQPDELAGRDQVRLSPEERDLLVSDWREGSGRHGDVLVRMGRLSEKELETLRLLHAGETVTEIAGRLDRSVPTIRARVRSTLAKLEVSTTLAAVAAYQQLIELVGGETPS
jgi:DNA-binding NarL/FixJ family response regulator